MRRKENYLKFALASVLLKPTVTATKLAAPAAKRGFLQNQRTLRSMCISSVDQLSSKKLALKLQRRAREQHSLRKISSSVIGARSNNDIEPQLEIYQDDNNNVISDDARSRSRTAQPQQYRVQCLRILVL